MPSQDLAWEIDVIVMDGPFLTELELAPFIAAARLAGFRIAVVRLRIHAQQTRS